MHISFVCTVCGVLRFEHTTIATIRDIYSRIDDRQKQFSSCFCPRPPYQTSNSTMANVLLLKNTDKNGQKKKKKKSFCSKKKNHENKCYKLAFAIHFFLFLIVNCHQLQVIVSGEKKKFRRRKDLKTNSAFFLFPVDHLINGTAAGPFVVAVVVFLLSKSIPYFLSSAIIICC